MDNIQKQRDIDRRLSVIEKKLGIDKYEWDWCCKSFKSWCLTHDGTTDKAHYTVRTTQRPMFLFFNFRFNVCPFCGEIFS